MNGDGQQPKDKQKPPSKHHRGWLGKGLSQMDKGAIAGIIDTDFQRGAVDWSDDGQLHLACKTITNMMQKDNELWHNLTPEHMLMTTPKYSGLFDYLHSQFKKRNGNSPERQEGMESPENKYALAPTETEES